VEDDVGVDNNIKKGRREEDDQEERIWRK